MMEVPARILKVYQPPGQIAPVEQFLQTLEPKLMEKTALQMLRVSRIHPAEMKEPHVKHFVIEKYSDLYELRERGKVLVRITFVMQNGALLFLHPFIKHQPRDTKRALDQSLRILGELQTHPEHTANLKLWKEKTACSKKMPEVPPQVIPM